MSKWADLIACLERDSIQTFSKAGLFETRLILVLGY